MPADWTLTEPVSYALHCSNIPCGETSQNSRTQQFTGIQTSYVPVVVSVTYNFPEWPAAEPIQCSQEPAFPTTTSCAQYLQNMGYAVPPAWELCTCSVAAANQMGPEPTGFFFGSLANGTTSNGFPATDFSHATPTQLTDIVGSNGQGVCLEAHGRIVSPSASL